MAISIYPPILQSTQPAFPVGTDLQVYFTLQQITNPKDSIGHVQIRVVNQNDNQSIIDTSKYPDGTIYKNWNEVDDKQAPKYSALVLLSDLTKRNWVAGQKYKIQMRFGTTKKFDDISTFATWKQKQIDDQTFSEWSTVMIVKAINIPKVYLQNSRDISAEVVFAEFTESTSTPLFLGIFQDVGSDEYVEQYKFDLYSGKVPEEDTLLDTSKWTYRAHEDIQEDGTSVDRHRFNRALENDTYFSVIYSIRTQNGYIKSSEPYIFMVQESSYYGKIENTLLKIDGEGVFERENGCISLYLKTENPLIGSFIIRRTDEKSKFKIWEDLQFISIDNKTYGNPTDEDSWGLLWRDYTVESGIKYKYSFQQQNPKGLRTTPIYDEKRDYALVNFEYCYIFRDGIQLKIKFNQKMNSFKHTILGGKQDTLGDKYPHVVKNGYAYYAEFPVTGLISFQMDSDQTFFIFKDDGFYYKDELVIPRDKFQRGNEKRVACINESHIFSPNTEKVIPYIYYDEENKEFHEEKKQLDGDTGWILVQKPKENEDYHIGNVVDGLDDLDKVPWIDTSLTVDNIFVERKFREKVEEFLNDYNYKLYKSSTEGNIVIVLTNVSLTPNSTLGRMIFEFSATAYEVIAGSLEELNEYGIIDIGEYEETISSDAYLSFGQIVTNESDIYNQIKQQEEISLPNNYKIRVNNVKKFWIDRTGNSLEQIIVKVDGRTIVILPNRIYSLNTPIMSLELVDCEEPIIVNYICELQRVVDKTLGIVTAIYSSRLWGQLAGVFTDTEDILEIYEQGYDHLIPPYALNKIPRAKYNIYKDRNLLDIIQDDLRNQAAKIYNQPDLTWKFDDEGNWTNGVIYHSLIGIVKFDIEADPGTILMIGKKEDGSDAEPIVIGPTARYILNPMDQLIKYIELKEPQFAIINFKCLTSQMRIEKPEEE